MREPAVIPDSIVPSVQRFLEGDGLPDGFAILHLRKNRRGMLLRANLGQESVLVKITELHGRLNHLRSILGTTTGTQEFLIHRMMEEARLGVPKTFGFSQVKTKNRRRFDLMVIEDLGAITRGVDFIKKCLTNDDFQALRSVEDTVIRMTQLMLINKVSDIDHHLNNIAIDEDESLFRIDFECARYWRFRSISKRAIGQMLGRLISSHVIACQDIDVQHSQRFAQELVNKLQVKRSVLGVARRMIEEQLDKQSQKQELSVKFGLPW